MSFAALRVRWEVKRNVQGRFYSLLDLSKSAEGEIDPRKARNAEKRHKVVRKWNRRANQGGGGQNGESRGRPLGGRSTGKNRGCQTTYTDKPL